MSEAGGLIGLVALAAYALLRKRKPKYIPRYIAPVITPIDVFPGILYEENDTYVDPEIFPSYPYAEDPLQPASVYRERAIPPIPVIIKKIQELSGYTPETTAFELTREEAEALREFKFK